jgi:hypothetical protein
MHFVGFYYVISPKCWEFIVYRKLLISREDFLHFLVAGRTFLMTIWKS